VQGDQVFEHGVLMTGATGVVGSALLPRLPHPVVALTHSSPAVGPWVRGDLTRPRLGLDDDTYGRLVAGIGTVVHAAAVTDFAAGERATADLNIEGTSRVLEFAAEAGARVLYVSTAFVVRAELTAEARGCASWEAAITPGHYLRSKCRAEALVASSGLGVAIARPSIVIGDSVTGRIARHQGLHGVLKALLRNQVPLLPLPPGSRVDVVPVDVVADALAALVDAGIPAGEYWLTAGPAAPTAQETVDLCQGLGADLGIDTDPPRFVPRDMVDRLLRPVFIDPLPARARRKFDDLMALCALFDGAPEFPTSLGRLPAGPPALTRETLRRAVTASVLDLCRTAGPAAEESAA
jgi:nucleoside-diphosphate-sugar epimerase